MHYLYPLFLVPFRSLPLATRANTSMKALKLYSKMAFLKNMLNFGINNNREAIKFCKSHTRRCRHFQTSTDKPNHAKIINQSSPVSVLASCPEETNMLSSMLDVRMVHMAALEQNGTFYFNWKQLNQNNRP